MAAISKRNLLLAAALIATLVAAWFAPEDPDSDLAATPNRDRSANRPAATAPAAAPPAPSTAVPPGPALTEAQRRDAEEERRRALAVLDVEQIRKRDGAREADDAFTRKSWYVPPPAKPAPPPPPFVAPPPPPPPPPPVAPPLPFKHLGRVTESGKNRPVHYLLEGERMLTVSEGDVIAGKYRFVGQIGNQLQFIYLPLDQRQTLPIAGTP
jgi:hypothetical protein